MILGDPSETVIWPPHTQVGTHRLRTAGLDKKAGKGRLYKQQACNKLNW